MVRKKREENNTKIRARMDITVDPENLKWLNGEIKKKVFFNRSHGVDYCLSIMKSVFKERETQIRELAQSQPIETLVADVDERIKDGSKGRATGRS